MKNFIMEVIDENWYKELYNLDTLYMNVTALKLLYHLTKFCLGIQTLQWFRSEQTTRPAASKREHSFCFASHTDKLDYGFA